jgi:hypothetical protein
VIFVSPARMGLSHKTGLTPPSRSKPSTRGRRKGFNLRLVRFPANSAAMHFLLVL